MGFETSDSLSSSLKKEEKKDQPGKEIQVKGTTIIDFALGKMYQLISGHKLVLQHLHKLPNARMIEKCSVVIYKQTSIKKINKGTEQLFKMKSKV